MMPLRLGFDLDGVLADFRSAFRGVARRCLGREIGGSADESLTPREAERVWNHIATLPNWWTTIEPYEPAEIPRLYELARASRWEVFFLTKRPPSGGDTVQFQTQWWLEQHGFYLPAVLTVPGSRGELANSLRLDLLVDDQLVNCAEVLGASNTKVLLMLREADPVTGKHATDRGVGVVSSLQETVPVLQRLEEILPRRRGRPLRLVDWFSPPRDERLPMNPRNERPIAGITGAAGDPGRGTD